MCAAHPGRLATGLLCLIVSAMLASPQLVFAESLGDSGRGSKKANPLKNVYFGEQHLHTQDSPDAFAMGTRNSQDDAFDFCKGKAIKNVCTIRRQIERKRTA
jgi:hypothetical protein